MLHLLHLLVTRCNHVNRIQTLWCNRWPAMADLRRFEVTVNARLECRPPTENYLSPMENTLIRRRWHMELSTSVMFAYNAILRIIGTYNIMKWHFFKSSIVLWVSNYLSLSVIRISIMSIIACDFNDLECFDEPPAASLKHGCHGHQGANLRWPNIKFCSQDIYQHICQI